MTAEVWVAATSARWLTEAAREAGFSVVAADVFGDRQTLAAADRWVDLRRAGSATALSGPALLGALPDARRSEGWVYGPGPDAHPDWIERGAQRAPLLGNDASVLRAVREPRQWFAALQRCGLDHPPVVLDATARERTLAAAGQGDCGERWLVKDAQGLGGWQVRDLPPTRRSGAPWGDGDQHPPRALRAAGTRYLQAWRAGRPMSLSFVADGQRARVLALNRQFTRSHGRHSWTFSGAVGPLGDADALSLPDCATQARLDCGLQQLVAQYGLRGMGSLDFLWDGRRAWVLELNPRPSAALQCLAGWRWRGEDGCSHSWFDWHVRACREGALPVGAAVAPAPAAMVQAFALVSAPRVLQLDDGALARLAAMPGVTDVPARCAGLEPGQPLCTVLAPSDDPVRAMRLLLRRRRAVLRMLESDDALRATAPARRSIEGIEHRLESFEISC